MGLVFSTEEELSQLKETIGSLLYNAMLEAGAVPDLSVINPLLLANHNESHDSQTCLQEQLQQLQGNISSRAPTYLRDLIGRLSTFSDEPRLAGLVGLLITMVMDMVYTSSQQSSLKKERSQGSSSGQRVWELQELMEEYLKRCRINLSDESKLIQDSIRLEAQLSLTLTKLKSCLLGGDCDSRSLRHWASGAAFSIQMLIHLAALEGKEEPLAAKAALEQYKEDITQIIPAYRCFKSKTVCVVKCRGALQASCDPSSEVPEEGSMTGLTVTDRETGKSVSIPKSTMEAETGQRRRVSGPENSSATASSSSSSINLDLITSDQYAQAYLDHLFSDNGPVAELENYFIMASDNLKMLRNPLGSEIQIGERNRIEQSAGVLRVDMAKDDVEDKSERRRRLEKAEEYVQRDESLKLSIVETQPQESLDRNLHGATST